MGYKKISLKEAAGFHGHLGPYLVLGILAGEFALKTLKAKKYFGITIKVWGANKKPKSCLVDGLQLSSGATYGKGNIEKYPGDKIKAEFCNFKTRAKCVLQLEGGLIQKLKQTRTHRDSEILAKKIYKSNYSDLFYLTLNPEP